MITFPLHTTRFVTAVLIDEEEQQVVLRIRGNRETSDVLEVELIDSDEVIRGDEVRMYEQLGSDHPMAVVEVVSKGVGVGFWSAIVDIRILEN